MAMTHSFMKKCEKRLLGLELKVYRMFVSSKITQSLVLGVAVAFGIGQ